MYFNVYVLLNWEYDMKMVMGIELSRTFISFKFQKPLNELPLYQTWLDSKTDLLT